MIFDIVFVDLNLIGAQKGTTAIEIIRNKNILSDILFYSVRKTDILIKLSDKFFEGIYVCNREAEEFIPKAQDIINKHILKTEDSSSIRGMLMSSVSNFDQKMKSIIIRHLESITFEERKVLDKYASKQVAEYIDYLTKTNESLINTDPGYISSALNRKKAYLLDSDKLARILNKIFEYLKKTDNVNYNEKYEDFISNFRSEILTERNILAHIESDGVRDFTVTNKHGNIIKYDSEKCNQIRQNINKYSSLFDEILENWDYSN